MSSTIHRTVGLSSFQKELWLAHEALPAGHPGISSGVRLLVEGEIDPETARQALRHLIAHFPLLSATLCPGPGGLPVFRIGEHPEPHSVFSDVSGAEDPERAAIDACEAFAETPFAPLGGSLVRFALIRFSAAKAFFLQQNFHLVGSGLANLAYFSLFARIYADILEGRPVDLGPAPDWQEIVDNDQAYAASARSAKDRLFWREEARRAPEQRVFPPLPDHPDQVGDSALYARSLSPNAMRHLKLAAVATGVNIPALLTTAHAIALRVLLDATVPVVFTVDNGERKDPLRMQGFMVNAVPVITELKPEMTFAEAAQSVATQIQRLRRHARTSVPGALRESRNLHGLAHLWDTNLNYIGELPMGNAYFRLLDYIPVCLREDEILLGMYVICGVEEGAPLRIVAQYSRNHFTEEGVRRYMARFEAVLAMAEADPALPLGAYSPLLADERAALERWESGEEKPVPALSIPQLFDLMARRHAERLAVCGENGSRRSYEQVRRHAAALAQRLGASGIGKGDVVAVLARRHPSLPECILGIMARGAVYLPVDPDYPAERVSHMLEDSGARLVVALEAEDTHGVVAGRKRLLWTADAAGGTDAFSDWMAFAPSPADPAYLIYTSGSTGTPKGVLVPHGGFVNMILAQIEAFGITAADHVLQFASPSFDASLSEIFMALMSGAASYPVSRACIDAPWRLRDYMASNAVSVVTFPPSYLALFKGEAFSGLRVLLTAGEAPVAEDARRYAAQLAYFNAYGPTEASVCAALQRILPEASSCSEIGRPLPNTRAHILDSRGRRVVPGMAGELWLSGAGLALGYHGRPKLTAERFAEPADLPGIRCYRTGDRAAWTADGRLRLLGRTDDQVKIRGQRVETGEVAAALEACPLVAQAVVVAVRSGSSHRLAAFILPRGDQRDCDAETLDDWLRRRLPVYMLPGTYHLVESFPLTPAGKVDKRALAARADEPAAPSARLSLSAEEARVAAIYAAVLGCDVEDPEEDFFRMGGDSLKAAELLHRLEKECGIRLAMRDFLAASSLRSVAGGTERPAPEDGAVALPPDGAPIPCGAGQVALWAQECSRAPSARYHMPLLAELRGGEKAVLRFVEAVREALAMQPLCTARLGGPVEAPEFLPFSLPVPPCQCWDTEEQAELLDRLDAVIHAPFTLRSQPPVRLALLRTAADGWFFALVMHHLAGDALGLRAVMNDAARLLAGEPLSDIPRAVLLREALAEERRFLASPSRDDEADFWRRTLLPLPPSLAGSLGPARKEGPCFLSGQGGQLTAELPLETAEMLRRLARRSGTTPLGAMLGLLGVFLCRRASRESCVVAVPVGTREGTSLSHVCGYFVNPVPVRLTLLSDAEEAARQSGSALRAAAAHSRLPARMIAEAVPPEQRAVLTEIFATHMDLGLPPLPEGCGLEISPRLPLLRSAKGALSFILLTSGPVSQLVLEYDRAVLDQEGARALLTDWAHFVAQAVGGPDAVVTDAAPEKDAAQCRAENVDRDETPSNAGEPGQDVAIALERAWHDVLGVAPQTSDNFFLSGGDSIKAIQLSGRLRERGFPDFPPAHCFSHPNFKDLCACLASHAASSSPGISGLSGSAAVPAFEAPHPGEAVPLPPLHAHWVARHPDDWSDFHMALPLRLRSDVDVARLKAGVAALGERHEALRIRFGTSTLTCEVPTPPLWLKEDFAPETPLEQCFAGAARKLFPQLSRAREAGSGPLYGAVFFRRSGTSYLLFAAHHFALDAFSLEIIRQELGVFCTLGEWPGAAPDCGAATWAKLLAGHDVFASERDFEAEAAFWRKMCTGFLEEDRLENPEPALRPDVLSRRTTLCRTVSGFVFDRTRRGGGLPEVLAGLEAALRATNGKPLLLTLETHGRESLLPGVDISRTVGWFTAAFPLAVRPLPDRAGEEAGLLEAADAWAARLDGLPLRGARRAFVVTRAPELDCRADMSLNYLGASLSTSGADDALEVLPRFASPDLLPGLLSPDFASDCPVDVLAFSDGEDRLQLVATFALDDTRSDVVAALLDAWQSALETFAVERRQAETEKTALARACLCAPEHVAETGVPDPAQEAMLYQWLLDGEQERPTAHYVQQITFALRSVAGGGDRRDVSDADELDVAALEAAWAELVRRHEGLRTLFPRTTAGVVRRVVLAEMRGCSERLDLTSLPPLMQQERRDRHLRELRETPFDLARGPLLFLTLLRRKDERGVYWEMSWCFPHLLMDGWCIGIMLRELWALYARRMGRGGAALPEAPSLARIRAALGPVDGTALREYWSAELAGYEHTVFIADTLARLFPMTETEPTDAERARTDGVMESRLELDAGSSRALSRMAARLSVSLSQLLQAAWALLLGGGRERDVVFGLVHSGRPASVPSIENAIGLFIRTLPVRVRWTESTPFAALTAGVRDAALARTAHERDMLADIQLCRKVGGALFDHILVFENYPLDGIAAGGDLRLEGVEGFERQPYPLALSVLTGETCSFRFSCDTRRIPSGRLEALIRCWHDLLQRLVQSAPAETTEGAPEEATVAASPACAALEATLPTNVVELGVPAFFNDTARPYERDGSIHGLFLDMARSCPERPACISMDGDIWSYAELAVAAARVAHALRGLEAGEPVALAMPRCPECVAAMLGVLMAGGCFMPLDERNPAERTRKMLDVAACRRVIYGRGMEGALPPDDPQSSLTRLEYGALMNGPAVTRREYAPGGAAPAYIMFTSGTTGLPKGVVVPHRGVLRLVRNTFFWHLLPGERAGQTGSFGFDAATLELWGALLNGGTVCFLDEDTLLSPALLRRRMKTWNISVMWLTAGLFSTIAAEEPDIFRSLRCLYSGGDTMSLPHAARVLAACPNLELYNGYGPTENTTFTSVHRVRPEDVGEGARSMPLGRPVSNTRVHIVTESGTLAAVGEWGEICAAGDGLALGYCRNPEATERSFHVLPGVGERVYRTGDLGRWLADGLLEFGGRRDAQIKLRGFRIEPEDIEKALLRLEGVRDAAVVVVGEGADKMLAAFVRGAGMASEREMRAALRAALPEYMIPAHIFPRPDLPVNSSGKRDRRALTALAERLVDAWKRTGTASAPLNDERTDATAEHSLRELEDGVAAVFSAVLDVPVEGAEADFFQLGGQSLKAMRLLVRLNDRFGVSLTLSEVLRLRTVGALAARIRTLHATAGSVSPAVERDGEAGSVPAENDDWPLSPAQEQLWFQQRLYPNSPVYSVITVFRLVGVPDLEALQRAFFLLEERHEALRLRLPDKVDAHGLRQRLAPVGSLRLHVEDCRVARDPAERAAQLVAEEQARPFRFGYDQPLARAHCFVESPDSAVLMLTVHHCLCDGWSVEVLLTDLDRAYAMTREGRGRTWTDAPASYLALVRERNERLASPAGRTALGRWVRRLSPLPEPLQLPADHPRPAVRSFEGGVLIQHLPTDLTAALRRRARENDGTLFPVLLALTGIFCFRHSGQRDMVLGVPAACRGRTEEHNVVGLLMNVLPLRLELNGEEAFDACVRRCAAVLGEALEDAECPMEHMLRELSVPRDAGHNPLFDVLVAFEEQSWAGKTSAEHLNLKPYPLSGRQSRLDLSFFFRDKGDELEIHWEYSAALFSRETVQRMAARFALLAEAVCGRGATLPVAHLPLLTPEDARLLERFNATREDWDCSGGIHAHFSAQAARTPQAPALRCADGVMLSYAEFARRTERLADWLATRGVRPGSAVGVCFSRGVGLLTAIFASIRAGGLYVPFMPDLPGERIRAMLQDLPPDTLLLAAPEQSEHLAEHVAASADARGCRVLVAPEESFAPARPALPTPSPDALAYILFTSGSTGRPKGVMVEQRGVLNRIFWMQSRFPLGPDDVILHKTPVSFDVSVWELFWWSWYGASLALLAPGGERDPAAIVEAVERHKVTVMHFVPSMLRVFLGHCARHPEAIARLASLKRVFASGEALTPDCVRLFNDLLYKAHGTELHNLYGPTEATVDVTWQPCSPFPSDAARVPIGRPVSNTVISVLDDVGQVVPLGVTGELVISGVQVARGYAQRPDLTAKVFGADPTSGVRWYRTGDLARWTADGVLEYLGRRDDQVKIRGFRIELGEVEAALEACPGVAQAVARVGSVGGLPALEAYLLPERGGELSLSEIRAALSRRLPAYMHPATFYRAESIPLGSSGKADRKALRGRRLDADGRERKGEAAPAPVEASLEEAVRLCWRAVLPEAGDLPGDMSFFDAGGSSLLLVRLLDRLQERWPGSFTLPELFASPSIGAQAQKLRLFGRDGGTAAEDTPLRGPDDRQGSIAIIGMALRVADYDDTGAFWSDLLCGADRVRALPERRCREQSSMLAAAGMAPDGADFKAAAYLDDVSGFDPARFGMAPGDARIIDPEQRLFFSAALRALEDAGYGGRALDNAPVGVFVGASAASPFRQAVALSLPDQAEQAYMLNIPSAVAARLSYLRNWTGPAAVVDTACSSVLAAVHQASAALRRGECSLALAGGARVQSALLQGTSAFAIESGSGRTLSFDADADGTCAGEGAAAFLLKPLEQALADRDAIHAVILGSAVNQDGRSAGIAAPNPLAQAAVIQAAAAASRIAPGDLHFIEAHGTGTALGDPVEIDGLRRAFADKPPRRSVPIGSVKGNFGHLDAAAGAVGLAKAVLTLQHGLVPGQPHFSRPNPRIDFAAASVHVAERLEPLPGDGRPWKGGISSFGLSGINAHVIVQEAPSREPEAEPEGWCCVPLSASSPDGLRRYARGLLAALEERPCALRDVAGTLACGREHLSFRVACAARSVHQLIEELVRWLCAGGKSHAVVPGAERAAVICVGEAEARAAATAFLSGAAPIWEADRTFARVHLPPVPLERVVCWPAFPPRATREASWPGEAAATPRGRHCAVPVHAAEFWPVAEHLVAGRPTLVGMAFPSLTGNVAARLRPDAVFVLENVHWLRPLTSDACAEAALSLIPQHDEFAVELTGCSPGAEAGENWMTFASARLRFAGADESPKPFAVAALRDGMTPLPFPAAPGKGQVRTSERWHCRKAAWRSKDGRVTLARLALPSRYARDLVRLPWHPALLDAAASLAVDDRPLLPAACSAVTLRRSLTQEVWAHCVLRSAGGEDASAALVADCTLYDDDGRELAALQGLAFLPPRQPQAHLHCLEWMPFSITKALPVPECPVLLVGEGPLCEDLTVALRARGFVTEALAYPRGEEACAALAERLRTSGVRHVLVSLPDAPTGREAAAPVRAVLRILSGGVSHTEHRLSWLCVGRPVGGRPVPEQALARGVLLSARREEARFAAAFVDLQCGEAGHIPATAAAALADCLFHTAQATPEDAERMAWLRLDAAGAFFSPGLSSPLEVDAETLPPSAPEECVLMTGGLGSMALTLAGQLVPRLGGMAALLHRGAFPTEADWDAPVDGRTAERIAALRELRRRGVAFRLYACDVTDERSLSVVLERVRRECGPIGTVIHTAGVPGDGFLLGKDGETFEAVVAPKLEGARLLHRLTLEDSVRHFVLASSRTALAGAAGQSDYTAANAALDSFARWRAAQGLPALSLAWNTWAETGMAARAGIAAPFMLSPDRAGDALLRALASGAEHVILSMPGEPLSAAPESSPSFSSAAALPTAAQGLTGRPVSEVVRVVMERVLGYEGGLTPDDDFYALGGDSLSGMRIVTAINAALGVSVGLADLLANGRIGAFCARVGELAESGGAVVRSAPAPVMPDYPVSREQLAVLRAEAVSGPHTGYNLPQFLPLPRECGPEALREVLKALTDRHEILRTCFVRLDQPEPRMVVRAAGPVTLPEFGFSTLEEAAAELIKPFDLREAPLFRAALLRIDRLPEGAAENSGHKVLFFDIHHSLADARGVGILLRDLRDLLVGKTPPPVGLQQKDAAWRQHEEEPEALRAARAYWLKLYADGVPRTDLAADFVRPSWHTNKGANRSFILPEDLTRELRRLAAAHDATLHSLLYAMWALLLSADADIQDMVMAVAADGRGAGFEETAGMFACLLPVRLRIEREQSVAALIRDAQRANTEALRYKDFPLGSLLAELKPPVDLSRTLLSEVTFSYMNYGAGEGDDAPYIVPNGGCKADLAIFVSDVAEGLRFGLEYYADLFAPARMEALELCFVNLAASLAAGGTRGTLAELLSASGVWKSRTAPSKLGAALPPDVAPAPAPMGDAALEAVVMEVYREYFGLHNVSAVDNFFELGGHSLLAMQIVNALNKKLGSGLTVRDLFAHPEPRLLAARLAGQAGTPTASVRHPETPDIPKDGLYPLSHAQQRLYVLHRMENGDTSYNMVFVFLLERPLDRERLVKALHALARRQDILRTVIIEREGALWQQVREDAQPPCLFHDKAVPEREACAVAVREALAPFDPARGMLRLCVQPTAEGGECLALGMHHLIGDGWSMQVFFGELMALYADPHGALPPLPMQYRDYALAQRGRDWSEAEAYWRETLRDMPGHIALPADAPAGQAGQLGRSGPAAVTTRMVDRRTLEKLRTFAATRRMTLASCLLALLAALLFRLSRQDDILIGLGVAGRERKELEGLVGFFVNILPIRVRVPSGGGLDELLEAVDRSCREALARQDYPFDLLVRECAPKTADARGGQMLNVMFEYQRYSDLAGINTLGPTAPAARIVDEEEWMPLAEEASPPARYDLTLYVQDEPRGCCLRAEYDGSRFTRGNVAQWLAFWERLMETSVDAEQ